MIITGIFLHLVLPRRQRSTVKPSARGRLASSDTKHGHAIESILVELVHIRDCSFAILEHVQVDLQAMCADRLPDEKEVGGIILNDHHRHVLTDRLRREY